MVLMSEEIDYGKETTETHNGVPVYETKFHLEHHEFVPSDSRGCLVCDHLASDDLHMPRFRPEGEIR